MTERKALVYGMRLFEKGVTDSVEPARVTMVDGGPSTVTMQLMEGTREELKTQLLANIDTFFAEEE